MNYDVEISIKQMYENNVMNVSEQLSWEEVNEQFILKS